MTAAEIIREVADEAGISPRDILGDSRLKSVTMARQEAMLRVRERTGKSFPQIGMIFNRDHSTVRHGCIAAAERRTENGKLTRGINMERAALLEVQKKIRTVAKDCVNIATKNLDQPSHISAALITAAASTSYSLGVGEEEMKAVITQLYREYDEVIKRMNKNAN